MSVITSETGGLRQLCELSASEVADRVAGGQPCAVPRLCHGFWELLLLSSDGALLDPGNSAFDFPLIHKKTHQIDPAFTDELLEALRGVSDEEGLFFSVSPYAYPGSYEIAGTPRNLAKVEGAIECILPNEVPLYDAMFCRTWVYSGDILRAFSEIAKRPVLLVGPAEISGFGDWIEADSCEHLVIPRVDAAKQRDDLAEQIVSKVKSWDEYGCVLFQAGHLAPLWILHLFAEIGDRCALLDLGQILDLHDAERTFSRAWAQFWRREVVQCCERIHPEADYSEHHPGPLYRSPAEIQRSGGAKIGRVDFVERKHVDWSGVEELLEEADRNNHWSNFGPASRQLESEIAQFIEMDSNRAAVACCSGTAALEAIAQTLSRKSGRSLRWAVSAFGFDATKLGSFRDSLLLDCTEDAILSPDMIEPHLDEVDGVVITNPFGIFRSFDSIIRLTESKNKFVIVDNAAGLSVLQRDSFTPRVFEAISFHHTKPFGFGEGGAVICASECTDQIRSLLNFGKSPEHSDGYGLNGKISEPSAALILQRLRGIDSWGRWYGAQGRRIIEIGKSQGLKVLGDPIPVFRANPGSIPFLSPRKVSDEELENEILTLRKYYQPLAPGFETAQRIYDHIINVPCHPDVAKVPTENLAALLRRFS